MLKYKEIYGFQDIEMFECHQFLSPLHQPMLNQDPVFFVLE